MTPQAPHPAGTVFALPAFATNGCAKAPTPLQKFKAKVKQGTRMTLIAFADKNGPAAHKFMNVQRVVAWVGSKQFGQAPDDGGRDVLGMSYCDWPKATELTWVDEETARIESHGVVLTYRFGAFK